MKATKKPVEIDYFEFTKHTVKDLGKLIGWVEDEMGDKPFEKHFIIQPNKLMVKTLEGTSYQITTDDMILRGISGEYYPCKKEIFFKTYDIN